MYHEVFSHVAIYNADNVPKILNAMRSGVQLKDRTSFHEDEFLRLVTLVSNNSRRYHDLDHEQTSVHLQRLGIWEKQGMASIPYT